MIKKLLPALALMLAVSGAIYLNRKKSLADDLDDDLLDAVDEEEEEEFFSDDEISSKVLKKSIADRFIKYGMDMKDVEKLQLYRAMDQNVVADNIFMDPFSTADIDHIADAMAYLYHTCIDIRNRALEAAQQELPMGHNAHQVNLRIISGELRDALKYASHIEQVDLEPVIRSDYETFANLANLALEMVPGVERVPTKKGGEMDETD